MLERTPLMERCPPLADLVTAHGGDNQTPGFYTFTDRLTASRFRNRARDCGHNPTHIRKQSGALSTSVMVPRHVPDLRQPEDYAPSKDESVHLSLFEALFRANRPSSGPPLTKSSSPWFRNRHSFSSSGEKTAHLKQLHNSMGEAADRAAPVVRGMGLKLGRRLACGQGGCVHESDPGTVLKFDRGPAESRLANHIASTAPHLKKLSVLPKYYSAHHTGVFEDPTHLPEEIKDVAGLGVHVIHREDIPDLQDTPAKYALQDLHQTVLRPYSSLAGGAHKPQALRRDYAKALRGWLDRALDEGNPEDMHHYRRVHYGLLQLARYGIIPCDAHAQNWGRRTDGSLVLRDAGCHRVVQDNPAGRLQDRPTPSVAPSTVD